MRINYFIKTLSVFSIFLNVAHANADITPGSSWAINYDWMDTIINKTPAQLGACPQLEVGLYKSGFKVARQKSFYGSVGSSGSKWFPRDQIWTAVGIGPIKNSFGIYFSDIDNLDKLTQEKQKKLPQTADEIAKWKVSDSAYWESQGGVGLYLGGGTFPFEIGVFAVATGGWANYLQKTGPNKVYVEMSKKYIKSVSFDAGVTYPNISIGKVKESSMGFAYQFTLDDQENIEAFERFMAGDTTKAEDLSKFKDSGVSKFSNMSEDRTALATSWGVSFPFIPILTFRSSKERAYDHVEENSVWDEKVVKDRGIYVKQRNIRIVGNHLKESRSFIGGRTLIDLPTESSARNITEKLFGNFKYTYQSDGGQERRLRKYVSRVKALTGLAGETCVTVPSSTDSLDFNQVVLEVNWSDSYVREIIGLGKTNGKLLAQIKNSAKKLYALKSNTDICKVQDGDNYDDTCNLSSNSSIDNSFKNLDEYSKGMKKSYSNDKKEFARNLAKFGEEVWKSPFIFKAFFERGKTCGQEFKYEVSGQRITRHQLSQKFAFTDSCITE